MLEKLFIQSIVDGYMQEWDKVRRQTHIALWEESVRVKGVPRWLGSQDDLKLLLMKAVNRKNPATGRYAIKHGKLSFLGRSDVSPGLLDRLRGTDIEHPCCSPCKLRHFSPKSHRLAQKVFC